MTPVSDKLIFLVCPYRGRFRIHRYEMTYSRYTRYHVICCCCCCCFHINSHNLVRGLRTGSSHSGVEEYPRKKTQTKGGTRMTQLPQFMPPPETYKANSGVSLRCARSALVHTSHYSRLENRLYRLPPRKDYHVYITCSTDHYAYARQTQAN